MMHHFLKNIYIIERRATICARGISECPHMSKTINLYHLTSPINCQCFIVMLSADALISH